MTFDESIEVAGKEGSVLAAARDAAVVLLELCPEHGELAWHAICPFVAQSCPDSAQTQKWSLVQSGVSEKAFAHLGLG